MNIKRFHAATSREALAKARMAFGEGTLILSNRPTANGVEVMATAEDTLSSLDSAAAARQPAHSAPSPLVQASQRQQQQQQSPQPRAPQPAAMNRNPVEEDTEQLAMSTLSFQDYVRERMLRRRHEAIAGPSDPVPMMQRSRDRAEELARERPAAQVARHNPLRSIPMDLPEPAPRKQQQQQRRSPCASRRSQQGWGAGTNTAAASQLRLGSGTRCALPTCWAIAPASRAQRRTAGRAKQWPEWSPLPPPSDRAEKRRAWGERVPKDTRIVV